MAEAAERLTTSIIASGATHFSFSSTGATGRMITPARASVGLLDVDVWMIEHRVTTESMSVAGLLEAVDIRANKFRIRDEIGNDIRIEDVVDLERAAQLIGNRVVATGLAERDDRDRIRLVEPLLIAEHLPDDWFLLRSDQSPALPQFPESSVADITDDEIEAFLAEIRE